MKRTLIILCAAAALPAGCMNLRSTDSVPAEELVPKSFSTRSETAFTNSAWWTEFESGELTGLVNQTVAGSLSLSKAAARLRQAKAAATKIGAGKIPEITAGASISETEREEPLIEGRDTRTESAELQVSASYEVDLWGRIASSANSARLDAEASAEDLEAAKQAVAAEATAAYFELLYLRGTIDLVKEQIATSTEILDLIELSYRRSQATALDVFQQREQLANAEALLPPLNAQAAVLLNKLCVLQGKPPGSSLSLKKKTLPALPQKPKTGLPVQLLERRPDVRAARRRLEAAHQGTLTAKAARLPAVRLSASAGYSSSDTSTIFDNWLARLAADIAGPIIDGKRRRAEVDRTEGVMDERLADYKTAILNAVTEVENALVRENEQDRYIAALEKRRISAARAFEQASVRYTKGSEPYLTALRNLNNLQNIQRQELKAKFDLMIYRVNLYRALSGAFKDSKEQK